MGDCMVCRYAQNRPQGWAPTRPSSQCFGQARYAFKDLVFTHGGKAQAEGGVVGVGAKERRARHEGNALFDGAFGIHIAISHFAARSGEACPNEQTALGLHKFHRITQITAQSIAHGLSTLGIDGTHFVQRGRHPASQQVLRGRGLGKGAGVCVAELFAHGGAGQ